MLVLSRKLNETLLIGDHITVTVVRIRSGEVRLGVEAPDGVDVDRKEVREAKEEKK